MLGLSFIELAVIAIVSVIFLSPKDWLALLRFFQNFKNTISELIQDGKNTIQKNIQDLEIKELEEKIIAQEDPMEIIKKINSMGYMTSKGTKLEGNEPKKKNKKKPKQKINKEK